MFVRLELSILYLLHKASKFDEEPGNLSLAKINVSIISLLIFFFPRFLIHYLNEIDQIQHYE